MASKDFLDDAKQEGEVIKGEATKDKRYSSQYAYQDEQTALAAFARSKEKLFDVDGWSDLPGLTATFELYDATGSRKQKKQPQVGDYIRIDLPGPFPENWVQVKDIRLGDQEVEFTVQPSQDPCEKKEGEQGEVEHFFSKEASSTFRVERQGNEIIGWEIGKNEGINNQGPEAGDRAIINTLVAEGGWAFFQKMQWKKLTEYLVQP